MVSIVSPGDDAPISSSAQTPPGSARTGRGLADVAGLGAARDIAKGQAISASDLVEKELDVSRIQRGFTPAITLWWAAKATATCGWGQLIGELDLQKAWAVKQGEGVLIRQGRMVLRHNQRGGPGEMAPSATGFKVKNLSSGKQIQAWVTDKGKLKPVFEPKHGFDSSYTTLGRLS
ncbi:flagella basal body P-ring formation protein FlgA [Aeromonas veronii]